jgi:cytochrome c oxidase subunit 2
MEIHRFEKIWLVVSLLLIVGFILTITYGAVGAGVKMVDDSGGTVDSTDPTSSPQFKEPGVYAADEVDVAAGEGSAVAESDYHVYVVARQFAFQPGSNQPIRVPAGSTVTFHLASEDVIHGFGVAGTNVNLMVIPGQIATATVEFDEQATYGIVCNEYCGAAHHAMEGQLQVVDPDSYEQASGQGGEQA